MLINATAADKEKRIDPRVKRTRKLLQQAFSELMAEKDFRSINVNDVTERAEVNRATFYLHFEDKYALLGYTLRESFSEMLEQRLPDTHTFSIDHLMLLTVTLCEFMSSFNGHCHPGTGSDAMHTILTQLQQCVYDLLLDWLIGSQPNISGSQSSVEYAAATLSWVVFGTALQAQTAKVRQSPEQWAEQAQQMLSLVTPGLRAFLGQLAEN